MSERNGIIIRPVGLYEVIRKLGESSVNIITACTSSKINKWSRCKPIRCPGVEPIDESTRKRYTYGLKVPILSGTFDSCIREITNQTDKTKWDYEQPTGGINSPYRLTDFENYYADAAPPFPITPVNDYRLDSYKGEGSITIRFDRWVDDAPASSGFPSYNVRIEDLATAPGAGNYNFQNFKLAVAVVNALSSTAGALRFESDKTLGQEGYTIKITNSNNLTVGIPYKCYPFFYYKESESLFVVVPADNSYFNLQVHNVSSQVDGIYVLLDGKFIQGVPSVDVMIHNDSNTSYGLRDCSLAFWKERENGTRYDECYYDYGNVGIGPNSIETLFDGQGTWRNGNRPTYNVDEITWMQFQSVVASPTSQGGANVNSEKTECW